MPPPVETVIPGEIRAFLLAMRAELADRLDVEPERISMTFHVMDDGLNFECFLDGKELDDTQAELVDAILTTQH